MKESIRQIVLSQGADVCGIANIERFSEAPAGFSPIDLFWDCKSVVTLGIALPKGLLDVKPRLIYGHFNSLSCREVDEVSFQAAKKIERELGCNAVPVPCDAPYEYWDNENVQGKGLMSMRHAAVLSGLGSIGKNSLLINAQYGTALTVGAILLDVNLPSDNLCESLCLERCKKCVESCPAGAIENGTVNQMACRRNTFGKTERGFDTVDCNNCRIVCPLRFGTV